MKEIVKNISFVLLLITAKVDFAENLATIKGKVQDNKNNPLVGANVYLEGRFEGASTDINGNFVFETPVRGKYFLIVSYIGYEPYRKEISVTKGRLIDLEIILYPTVLKSKEITVTASSFTTGEKEGVTLTSLEVVTTPGAAADVCRALKIYPGVQQVEKGAGLFVRGGDVSETKFILDGAVIEHPYKYESLTGAGGGVFGMFAPYLLKGTYFSTGGFSVEYGDALSGVLSMESCGMPAKFASTIGIGLSNLGGIFQLPIIEDNFGLSLSGNVTDTKYLFKLNPSSTKFTRFPSTYDINLNIVYKLKNGQIKALCFKESDETGAEVETPIYTGVFTGKNNSSLYNFQIKYLFGERFGVTSNLALSKFDGQQRLNILDIDRKEQLYQFRFSMEYEINSGLTLRSGVTHFRNWVKINGRVPEDETDISPDAPLDTISLDWKPNKSSLFLENRIRVFDRFFLVPGFRFATESFSNKSIFDPRISGAYEISKKSFFRTSVGVYHQYPEPRYYDENIGNPNLKPMSSVHYIGGYELTTGSNLLRLEAYYKDYRDLLLNDSLANYSNNGYGYATGTDCFLKRDFGKLNGWFSYSYLIARRKAGNFVELSSPDFNIPHNLTLVAKYMFTDNFNVGCTYRYATGKPYTPSVAEYNTQRVPDYQRFDVSLFYLHNFYKGNLTVFYLMVSNLFNRINIFDYVYSADYSTRTPIKGDGRSIYFGVSIDL